METRISIRAIILEILLLSSIFVFQLYSAIGSARHFSSENAPKVVCNVERG